MTELIEVEKIQRLDIKPGETLVVTLPRHTHVEHVDDIRRVLTDRLPDGVKLLIVSGNVEIGVIAADTTVPPTPPIQDNQSLGEYFGEGT